MDAEPSWRQTRHATFLQGQDGKVYILPDEVLNEYEVPEGEHLRHARHLMRHGNHGGFTFAAPRICAVGHVDVPEGFAMAMVVWSGEPAQEP